MSDKLKELPQEKLSSLISSEHRRLASSFGGDSRWALLEIVRSIDFHFYAVLSLSGGEAEGVTNHEPHYNHVHGRSRALSSFIDGGSVGDSVPLYPSIPTSQDWADALIQHCGRLDRCQTGLDMVHYGVASLEEEGPTKYCFRLIEDAGIEAVEREPFGYVLGVIEEMDNQAWTSMLVRRPEMLRQMGDIVYPWKERFIGYTARPEIDSFYAELGVLWSRRLIGQDTFPGESGFGGLPFHMYRAAQATLAGFALKHIDFCQALRSKRGDLDLRNILTTFQERESLEATLGMCLEVPADAAKQVVDVLTLTPQKKEVNKTSSEGYLMPLVQIGEKHLIRSVAGSLINPVGFLLAELRRLFPRDWDAAVNEREKWFRRELYDLFPETHLVTIDCPVILRTDAGRIVTDVDAAVFDTRNSSLGLFQLKWQDPFGASFRKRESRMRNLIPSANTWVKAVTKWILGKSVADFRQQFRLPKTEVVSAFLFVVGRNFVSFSGGRDIDRRAAWGTWPQVVELLAEERVVRDPIRGLFEALQGDSAAERAKKLVQELEPEEFTIGDSVIRIQIG